MNVLLVTIPLSLLLLICAVVAFFWAVDHDQFDDMETPGLLPLDDGDAQDASSREEPPP
jgi:cbb3-type cytochrome oxidase maturation protein